MNTYIISYRTVSGPWLYTDHREARTSEEAVGLFLLDHPFCRIEHVATRDELQTFPESE